MGGARRKWTRRGGRSCVGGFRSRAARAALSDSSTSFLATVPLSPKTTTSAVLRESLQGDPTGSGKEQIAAALCRRSRRTRYSSPCSEIRRRNGTRPYTDKGAKKTAKGSVFQDAAEQTE